MPARSAFHHPRDADRAPDTRGLMTPLTDMGAADNQRVRPSAPVADPRSYVLIADAQVDRAAACLESIQSFNVNARVARDGDQALQILRQSGAPILLIVDLALARTDGFGVIEALRASRPGRSEIIAWSSTPDLREFAAQRLAGLDVKILGGAVAPDVLRGAVHRALRRAIGLDEPIASHDAEAAEDVYDAMTRLSERARKLSGAAGVAVYWKAAGETKFRASVTWASDTPAPHSPYHLPRVFGWIIETGEALVMPDLTGRNLADVSTSSAQDVVRGLVAVPIVGADQEIAGTICVFDLKPLTFGDDVVEALKALGREGLPRDAGVPPVSRVEWRPTPMAREGGEPAPRVQDVPDWKVEPSDSGVLDRADAAPLIVRELSRLSRELRPMTVVAFDVSPQVSSDGAEGAVLAGEAADLAGETLARAIRGCDIAVRWNPDDLLLLLPGLRALEARPVAERVRAAMQAGARHRAAVSGGIAELLPGETFDELVARAKEQLRIARARGNRVA
jgi:CheY-like chemotaxis protein